MTSFAVRKVQPYKMFSKAIGILTLIRVTIDWLFICQELL